MVYREAKLLLVLEWVEGRTLTDWLSGAPSYEERLAVTKSMLDTLTRIHALGIAHGDLHPQNIIVKKMGRLY